MQGRTEIADKFSLSKKYRELYEASGVALNSNDAKLLKSAVKLLMEAHQDKADDIKNYHLSHSIEVAIIVAREMELHFNAIICALLQYVLKDTDIKPGKIEKLFGPSVRQMLETLTKIARLRTDRISMNAGNFINLLLTITDDVRIILIRLADRLHYMRTLNQMNTEDKIRISSETSILYAPLAHRLGLYNIKTELEELSMRFLQKEMYESIEKKLKETEEEHSQFLNNFMIPVRRVLHEAGFKYELKGRTKSVNSIHAKMVKQNVEFHEVYDLFAVRVIPNNTIDNEHADCWKVYSLISNIYQPDPKRLRDWITTPKENGYESLHTTVLGPHKRFVEVQIRTKRMDENAEKGYAAHWRYKGTGKQQKMDEWLNHLRNLLEKPEDFAFHGVSGTKTKEASYIFVFTPQGDLKKLPAKASVLDFAYEVHSGLGEKCTGAKVNGNIVPIKHELKNGDQVEILSSRNQKPNLDWLNWVVTGRARNKIKRYLREARYNRSEEGKDILRRKLSQLDVPFNDEVLNKLMLHFTTEDPLEFYQQLAEGKIEPADIKEVLLGVPQKSDQEFRDKIIEKIISKATGAPAGEYALLIEGNPDIIDYKLAKCCMPSVGDDIFGFITVSDGIKIHNVNCPNAHEMRKKYAYRIVKAQWVKKSDIKGRISKIHITGTDRSGLLNSITRIIENMKENNADLKINLESVSFNSRYGNFEGTLRLFINDDKYLKNLIHKIKEVEGVSKVASY